MSVQEARARQLAQEFNSPAEAANRLKSRGSGLLKRLYLVRLASSGQAFIVSGQKAQEPRPGDYLMELEPSGVQRQWLVQGA